MGAKGGKQEERGTGSVVLGRGPDLKRNSRHSDAPCERLGTAFLRPGRPGLKREVVCFLVLATNRPALGASGGKGRGGVRPGKAASRRLPGPW